MKLKKLFPALLSGLLVSCPYQKPISSPSTILPTSSASDPVITSSDLSKLDSLLKEPYSPSPIFRTLWEQVEECTHSYADFDSMEWFHVKSDYLPCSEYPRGKCNALWVKPNKTYLSNRVIRALESPQNSEEYTEAQNVIKHEMVHEIKQETGHPKIFDTCGRAHF